MIITLTCRQVAQLGYYAVRFEDYGTLTELAAVPRAGKLRFTYPRANDSRIQIDLARRIGPHYFSCQ